MVKVTICMGSSCFSRGNSRNLEAVRAWLAAHGREAEVQLTGCRCGNRCGEGPNIWIGGGNRCGEGPNIWIGETCHSGVTPEAVPALLAKAFGEEA